mgnify:CR=1 FL=1
MMHIDKKIIKIYVINFFLCALFCTAYSYFFDKNYLINIASVLDGFAVFSIIIFIYFYLANRNSSNKLLSPGFVVYELIYAFLLKFAVLIFLLTLSFKIFDLNNKMIILTFSYMVILRLIIYFKRGLNDNLR